MIRFLFALIFMIIVFTLSIPMFLVEWIIGLFSPAAQEKIARGVTRFAFITVTKISGVKVTYKGLENVPTDKPVMYAANHNSFFDVILTFTPLPGRVAYLAKKEFRKYFFLSIWMIFIKCLFLDRKDIKQGLKTILAAIENTKNGVSMFVFPEGTRSKDGKMLEFHEGSFKIATKAGVPIIPVAITNTAEIFERHLPKISAEKVTIEFGKPINTSELPKETLKTIGAYTQGIIQEMLDAEQNS